MVTYEISTETPIVTASTAAPEQGKTPCPCAARKARIAAAESDYCNRLHRVGRMKEITAIVFMAAAVIVLFNLLNKQ